MAIEFSNDAVLHDHRLKQHRLVFQASAGVSGQRSDLPGVASISVTDAANGQFTVLLEDVKPVAKVYVAAVTPSSGTATIAASVDSQDRISLAIDSSLDLSAADVTVTIQLDYLER